MRRPGRTPAQRQHDREALAILRVKRASARYGAAIDAQAFRAAGKIQPLDGPSVFDVQDCENDVTGAALALYNALTPRERRRLAK